MPGRRPSWEGTAGRGAGACRCQKRHGLVKGVRDAVWRAGGQPDAGAAYVLVGEGDHSRGPAGQPDRVAEPAFPGGVEDGADLCLVRALKLRFPGHDPGDRFNHAPLRESRSRRCAAQAGL